MVAIRAAKRRTAQQLGVALLAAVLMLAPPAHAQTDPSQGSGGPILVVAEPGDAFGRYYAEILRAEGLNAFTVTDAGSLSAQSLAAHQVVLLAGGNALSDAQVGALSEWVQGGGNLIAFRPAAKLAPLLGLGGDAGDLAEGYLRIDTSRAPGAGLTGDTMQFHGVADRRPATDAATVATLYENAGTPTASPAVTLRDVGSAGGQSAAFMYDLARSVVLTRQGNPAWAKDKRDSTTISIRPADLFYGAKAGDVRPDWVDFGKIAIPQADEQQRLLANLVTSMNLDRAPLPRFWYLPRGEKAAVVMTGDDHANGGTPGQFDAFKAKSRPGCSVALWQCVRSTSYIYSGTPLTDAQADAYEKEGFEVAMHLSLGCQDFSSLASLEAAWDQNLATWTALWPSVTRPRTNRTHCVTWSDWASMPKAELRAGVRFDTNYYYAADAFVKDRPGMFTGSGFPMRFTDENGAIIDVYQATTQLSDESKIDYAKHISALLDGALGPNGYYGVFTANMHTDDAFHAGANTIVAAAQARNVPIVTSVQMLDWLDGRNGSSFQQVGFDAGRLRFTIAPGAGANGLEAMVPAHSARGPLLGLTADGTPVATTSRTVKGVEYAVFPAAAATYVATYPGPGAGPPAAAPPQRFSGQRHGAPTTVRATARGSVRVRVACRRTSRPCKITVRLRYGGKTIARGKVRVRAGKRVQVTLRLPRPIRQKLAQRGSLSMTAVISGHRPGKPKATTRRLRVLAAG